MIETASPEAHAHDVRGVGEWPLSAVRHPAKDAAYVVRECEGCLRPVKFAPEGKSKELIYCTVCRRQTWWRVVVLPEGLQ